MSLKNFLLGRMNRAFARTDLPPRDDRAAPHTLGDSDGMLRPPPFAGRFASGRARGAPGLEHLGAYRPLIAAIREELERFVQSDLRLHLAIAEHDRYVLTSIAIESVGSDESRDLLARFAREFAPEQVKHYLAKEIIARLPNASAIDLSQFSGLRPAGDAQKKDAATGYEELIAELRSDVPESAKAYEVTLNGRWSEKETREARAVQAAQPAARVVTPLAGHGVAVDIEDAGGARRVDLAAVVPGRRYVVGKDAGCDIVVDGVYASRRHCELWLDKGVWWATDCGSTNGIRVEPPALGGLTHGSLLSSAGGDGKVLAIAPGARIVLSASAHGEPAQYPRVALRAAEPTRRNAQSEATPVTPIVAARRTGNGLTLTVRMASGTKTVDLPRDGAPLRVGRSRTQGLVIDWAHESVSGHHVDIAESGDAGARVVVHGDNGVIVDGAAHAPGAQFEWNVGETMLLGRAVNDEPECALTLSRDP
jgi:hypothetical protein